MTYCAIRPGPYDAGAHITSSNNLRTLMRATTRAVGQSGEAMIYKTEDLSVVYVSPSGAQVYRPKNGVFPVAIKHAHLGWIDVKVENRVGGPRNQRADLSHHRAYRPVHGGSTA